MVAGVVFVFVVVDAGVAVDTTAGKYHYHCVILTCMEIAVPLSHVTQAHDAATIQNIIYCIEICNHGS